MVMKSKEHYIFLKMFPEDWAVFNRKTLIQFVKIIAPERFSSEGEGTEQSSNVLAEI